MDANSNFCISVMNLEDLENIKNILENDFDDFWNFSIFKTELENPLSTYFAIKSNSELIGFAGVLIVVDEADITNIVVKKSFRGMGISNLLLKHIISYCKKLGLSKINLEVSSKNNIAINLYKKFGFVQVGIRKNYYKNNSALLFTKIL